MRRSPGTRRERGNVLGLHHLEHRERGARGERLAAEGGGVVAGLERGRDLLARPTRADRHAVAERLGHGDDVGAHTVGVLEPEPLARAAEPGLHLVDDQQRLALVAERTHRREVAVGRGDHTALALDRLEHHRADALVHRRRERVEVAELDLAEADRQRLEHFLLLRLAGGGERGERAAVERAVGGDHVEALGPTVSLPVATRELDRALVRLGTGVGEEHATVTAEQRVEPGRHLRLHVVVVEVRHVEERARLVGERVGNRRMRVTERRDREAAEEVEVLLALAVPEAHALAAHERDRLAPVGLHHVFGVERDDVVERRHTSSPPCSTAASLRSSCRCPHA